MANIFDIWSIVTHEVRHASAQQRYSPSAPLLDDSVEAAIGEPITHQLR
jgi:hypothetical protein